MPSPLRITLLALPAALLSACTAPTEEMAQPPRSGPWRMEMALVDTVAGATHTLPFLFDLERVDSVWRMHIHNGDEVITADEVALNGDSLHVRMPLYDSDFHGRVVNDSTIVGLWHNHLKGPDYRIAFTAHAGSAARFPEADAVRTLGGQWEVHFGADGATPAIGLFQQEENGRVTGTFATETGDYRFLEGAVRGDSLFLSAFNGSQAFLFKAALRNDSLHGRFWSGIHYQDPWVAVRNPAFRLRNEDSLTFLREGYDMVDFHFPGIDGGDVSPKDADHRNHVLLVQVMGSWCPNCVDESRLLNELYAAHHAEGLDVVAVAFERTPSPDKALQGLRRFRDELGVRYPIAYAGMANKDTTAAKLPFLDKVMGYPTCVFIGRDGTVRRIRTGFSGPGTGTERYAAYKRDLERFVTGLLQEPAAPLASKR